MDYLVREELSADILIQSLQEAISSQPNHSSQSLTADLRNTQLLHDLSTRLVTENDIQVLYDEIVATAIALTRADAGTVQILEEETQELVLLATQGFEPSFIAHFYRVNASSNTSCGIALARSDRTFIDFDMPKSEDPDGSLRMHLEAGFYSAQSTPLISRSGKTIGMVSIHWRKYHRPTERELQFLDLLARQAADLIEQMQAQAVLRESEAQLQSIANLVPDLLWDSEPDGSTNWYNHRWMEYTGQTFEQAIGWGWSDAIHPDDRATSARRYHEAVQQGVQLQQEHRIRRYDGEYRWFAVKASPLKDENGKVIKMYGAATDIHDRWVALEALRKSEAIHHSLFNSMDEGYFVCEVIFDENDRPIDLFFIDENPAAVRMTGQSFRGRRLREINPDYKEYWYELFGRVAQTGQAERLEQYSEPDGIWYDFFVFKVDGDERGRIAVIFQDISDRKRVEEQLHRTAEIDAFRVTLADALRSLSDPVEIQRVAIRIVGESLQVDRVLYGDITPDGKMWIAQDNYTSGRLPKLLGSFPTAAFGASVGKLKRGELVIIPNVENATDLTEAEKALYEAYNTRSVLGVPLIKDSRWISNIGIHHAEPREWTVAEIALVQETAERTWAAVERAWAEAAMHKSELQRVQEQAAREQEHQRAETLAELDRAKTKFFSNISHEFRTPLTLLLAPLEDALRDFNYPLSEPQRERIELSHRNGLRLLKLVNSLLDFSRVEAGRLHANYESTDLATYTVDLVSNFRSAIESGGLELVVDCPSLPESVCVDRSMWEKIVLNLLSNAFKFTFEGTITVSLQATPKDSVKLIVRDTGIGIDAEELPQIFDRFYQSQGRQGRSSEGLGIGLSLVRELVKLHGGEIEVSSEVDRGTTFTVTIPTEKADLASDRLHQNKTKPPTDLPTPTSTTRTANSFVAEAQRWLPQAEITLSSELSTNNNKRGRILIVDDNADLQSYLQRLLNQAYEVETANNGLAALNKIRAAVEEDSSNYDLVLADIMMPEIDGFELLRSLRADPTTQEIPIILLSARAGEESRVEGLANGADDYLVKPFSPRELLARVNTHLQLVQMRQEVTYRKRVMQELEALNKTLEDRVRERTVRLQEINQELEAFSYSVSHDLQTPLNYISSFTEKLQKQLESVRLDSSSQKYLKIISESAKKSREIVHDLLEFSRLGQSPLRRSQVSMNLLVESVRQQLELEERVIHWQIEPLPEVSADPTLLRLVLQNLMSNAVKYTSDRAEAEIAIGSYQSDREIVFFVRDNGVGFEMQYHDKLFELFQRLHSQFAGTGVGLAQVKRIIHRHGGRIWAEGEVGRGATFYFTVSNEQ